MTTYSPLYPPAHNSTYVKATTTYDANFQPWFGTDPALSLLGDASTRSWLATTGSVTNQKFNVDLGVAQLISRVHLENYHQFTTSVVYGIKDFAVYGALDNAGGAAAFADTTYANTANLVLLGSFTAAQHVAADTADPQYFTIASPGLYRYYILRIATGYHASYMGFRHVAFQEVGGVGGLALSSIDVAGTGGTFGVITLPGVGVGGAGGGVGAMEVGVDVAGAGGGAGIIVLSSIDIAGTGETSVLTDVGGSLGYTAESGITLWPHVSASVTGSLGYTLTSEILIDEIAVGGELSYSATSGITAHAQNDTAIAGDLGYALTSGVVATSHIAVSAGGALTYELTSGVTAHLNLGGIVGGTLPYEVDSGISAWPSPQVDVEGDLGYVLTSGVEASGGDSCSGALAYVRPTVC